MTDSTWQSCEASEDLCQGKKTTFVRGRLHPILSTLSIFQQLSDGGTWSVHRAQHGRAGGSGHQGRGPGGDGASDGGTWSSGTEDK